MVIAVVQRDALRFSDTGSVSVFWEVSKTVFMSIGKDVEKK